VESLTSRPGIREQHRPTSDLDPADQWLVVDRVQFDKGARRSRYPFPSEQRPPLSTGRSLHTRGFSGIVELASQHGELVR
jgi:hypothetical protein